jgi:serine/threonine protein kinase
MASIYYALHARLESPLAIKVLHAHLVRDSGILERFRREADVASRLRHPHIVPVTDYVETRDTAFSVMPYFSGGSLADIMIENHGLPSLRVATAVGHIAKALDYAHRHNIVHRDVKPDNILFDEDGHALLTDFGIMAASFHSRLTNPGRAMGTPHYMSPEQAQGRMVDGRSDLYAAGVVLFELLLGFLPFDGADAYSIGYKHIHDSAPSPSSVDPRIPEDLSHIVMRCLEKDPDRRYQRGFELADALTTYVARATSEVGA